MSDTKGKTATEMMQDDLRLNLRLSRAYQFAAAIMALMEDHIDDATEFDHRREAYDKLVRFFHNNGFDTVTDLDREALHLLPRDEKGWTAFDMAEYERRTLYAMMPPTVRLK